MSEALSQRLAETVIEIGDNVSIGHNVVISAPDICFLQIDILLKKHPGYLFKVACIIGNKEAVCNFI
jgi:acetyltransferase-like isoleucine patch superfamily enzyme